MCRHPPRKPPLSTGLILHLNQLSPPWSHPPPKPVHTPLVSSSTQTLLKGIILHPNYCSPHWLHPPPKPVFSSLVSSSPQTSALLTVSSCVWLHRCPSLTSGADLHDGLMTVDEIHQASSTLQGRTLRGSCVWEQKHASLL